MTAIKREERIGGQRLLLGDCLQVMPELGRFDAVVMDPPYGIGWKPRVNHHDQKWVDEINFDIAEIAAVGDEATIWGAEYLAPMLPPSKSWLTWVKRPASGFDFSTDSRSYATAELAWTTVGKTAFVVHVWDGGMRAGAAENRTFCHPSQKPIEVMEWCVRRHAGASTILDPFMGSGTTLVACQRLGRRGTGIEIDPDYWTIACERVHKAWTEPDLFIDTKPSTPVQETLFNDEA